MNPTIANYPHIAPLQKPLLIPLRSPERDLSLETYPYVHGGQWLRTLGVLNIPVAPSKQGCPISYYLVFMMEPKKEKGQKGPTGTPKP